MPLVPQWKVEAAASPEAVERALNALAAQGYEVYGLSAYHVAVDRSAWLVIGYRPICRPAGPAEAEA